MFGSSPRTHALRPLRMAAAFIIGGSLIVACGGGGSSTSEPTQTTAAAQTTAPSNTGPSTPSSEEEMAALVAAAQAEGRLVFYSASTNEINEAVAAAFTEKYGIQVEILRAATTALLERFVSEQDSGVFEADVLNSADPSIFVNRSELFVPLDEETIPGFDAYPEGFRTENYVIVNVSPYVITYNTDLVKEEDVPKTWADILSPAFEGKTLLTDPRATPNWMYWAWSRAEYLGDEWLEGIKNLNFDLVDSSSPGAQQVAAGAYAINYPAVAAHSAALRAEGAPVGIVLMPDNSSGTVQAISVSKNAKNPNAARLFVMFHASTDGLQASCSAAEIGSPDPAATNCVALPDGWTAPDLSKVRDSALQTRILGLLGVQ